MKKVLFPILFVIACFTLRAQQQALFTQYMFNQLALNPAYAGVHEGISASLLWREQWIGFEGAPRTQTMSVHSPIGFRPISLGLLAMHDEVGLTSQNSVTGIYSYRIKLGNTRLAFGVQASMNFFKGDFSSATIADPLLAPVSASRPNFGTGVLWHADKFYVGVSIPQIDNQKLDPSNDASSSELIRHYFISGGYVFALHENIIVKPNVLFKYVDGAPLQADFNLNMLLQPLIWLGVSYRSLESVSVLFQLQISSSMQLGYSYDLAATSRLAQTNSGSHEIMLNYVFPLPQTKILTPRYF